MSLHPPDTPALTLRVSMTLNVVDRLTVPPGLSKHLLVGTEKPAVARELCLEERAHITLPEAACTCRRPLVYDGVCRAEQDPHLCSHRARQCVSKHRDMRDDTGTNSSQERARVASSGKGYRAHPPGTGNSIHKGMEV